MRESLRKFASEVRKLGDGLLYRLDPARDVRSAVDGFRGKGRILSLPEAYKEVALIEARKGRESGSLRPVFDRAVDEVATDISRFRW